MQVGVCPLYVVAAEECTVLGGGRRGRSMECSMCCPAAAAAQSRVHQAKSSFLTVQSRQDHQAPGSVPAPTSGYTPVQGEEAAVMVKDETGN